MGIARVRARDVLFPSESLPPAARESLEISFYSRLRLPNGTYKLTHSARLDDLNIALLRHAPSVAVLRCLDAGISTGVTTLEWATSLRRAGLSAHITGTELYLECSLTRLLPGLELLFIEDAWLAHFSMGPWGVFRPIGPSHWIRSRILNRLFALLAASHSHFTRYHEARCARARLVVHDLDRDSGITLIQQDIFERRADWSRCFDIVRVANLLNLSYFPPQKIRAAIRVLFSYLAPRGLLALARTDTDGSLHASVFVREGGERLAVLERLGRGSEIEDLALQAVAPEPGRS